MELIEKEDESFALANTIPLGALRTATDWMRCGMQDEMRHARCRIGDAG